MTVLLVALAGAVGAVLRYLVDVAVAERLDRTFPYGTLTVNVTGSLVLGLISGLALYHGLPNVPRTVLGTGFCGAYTTFSTFTFETARLAEDGATLEALANILANAVLCLGAAALGLLLAA